MSTVKELEAKVAHLEGLINKQADVIGELFDRVANLEGEVAYATGVVNEGAVEAMITAAVAKLEARPQRAAPAGPVAASREARVAAIKRLAAANPSRKSFTPAEVQAEVDAHAA